MQYYVYMITNWNNRVLYIGVTNNLERRLYEHREHLVDGFTSKYNVNKLVYYEVTNDVRSALERERELKGWTRIRKNTLITQMNPAWVDLTKMWE